MNIIRMFFIFGSVCLLLQACNTATPANPEIACTFALETKSSRLNSITIRVPPDTDTSISRTDWQDFHIELTYVRFQPENKKDARFFVSLQDLTTREQIVGQTYISPKQPFTNVYDNGGKSFTGDMFVRDPKVADRKIVYWCFTLS